MAAACRRSLRTSSRRYRYGRPPAVIDAGLRLADIERFELVAERQRLTQDPATLARNGASADDIAFLGRGLRVELNMLASDRLVALIEERLAEAGVAKVVPHPDILAEAWRRTCHVRLLERAVIAAAGRARRDAMAVTAPADLAGRVVERLRREPDVPWDDAVSALADEALQGMGR